MLRMSEILDSTQVVKDLQAVILEKDGEIAALKALFFTATASFLRRSSERVSRHKCRRCHPRPVAVANVNPLQVDQALKPGQRHGGVKGTHH